LSGRELTQSTLTRYSAGFKARPRNDWTLYFDGEYGEHDNVFARIGNYVYTNFRLKSRYQPSSRVAFNVSVITKDNSNPSEIAGVSFWVNVKPRIFISTVDRTAASRFGITGGYNYHWLNSKAIVDYFFNSRDVGISYDLWDTGFPL
jgi:hypothetical protein